MWFLTQAVHVLLVAKIPALPESAQFVAEKANKMTRGIGRITGTVGVFAKQSIEDGLSRGLISN
jgi:Na+/alanine symporter